MLLILKKANAKKHMLPSFWRYIFVFAKIILQLSVPATAMFCSVTGLCYCQSGS